MSGPGATPAAGAYRYTPRVWESNPVRLPRKAPFSSISRVPAFHAAAHIQNIPHPARAPKPAALNPHHEVT